LSKFYNSQRIRNLYAPQSGELFKISRTKIDLFLNCPKCFYLDRRLGINQPPSFPFSLNAAVDLLLKKEFICLSKALIVPIASIERRRGI